MYDFSLATVVFEKQAKKTIASSRMASRILSRQASPGPNDSWSRQYGMCAASNTLHSLSTRVESSCTYEMKTCFVLGVFMGINSTTRGGWV